MKKMQNNLDERQEQELLKIEHNGCWFAFWGLLAAIFIEQFIFGVEWKYIVGEWIVFMILAIYMAAACLRHGIWDRHLKANTKTNLIASLLAGFLGGGVFLAIILRNYPGKPVGAICAAAASFAIIFLICFAVLQAMKASYNRKIAKMEEEPEEEE